MSVIRSSDLRPGVRTGIAVGLLGVTLLAAGFALEVHAGRGELVAPGQVVTVAATTPVHLVGVVEPGADERESAVCVVATAGGTETIEVGTRREAFEAIRAGRRLRIPDGEQATVVCDRSVAVAIGPVVSAYPLAGAAILYPIYAGLAILGFTYALRRSRSPARASSPVQLGDDESTSEAKRFAVEMIVGALGMIAGIGAIMLGIVGLLVLREGSPEAWVFLLPAGVLALVARMISRRRRPSRSDG